MKHDEKPLFKHKDTGWFAITPCLSQLLIIGVVLGCYYYINKNGYFPLWITWIYYGSKILIGLEIIIAGAKSLAVPSLAIVLGAINFYLSEVHGFQLITNSEAWQLIGVGIVALLITCIVHSLKYSKR